MELLISFLVGMALGWFVHPQPPVLQVFEERNSTFDWQWRDAGAEVCLEKENFSENTQRSIRIKTAYEKCAMQTQIFNEVVHGY